MKNLQKGFVIPILLVIVALLVVGGGVYIYENKKAETPVVIDNTQTPPPVVTPSPNPTPTPTPTPSPTPKPSPTPTPIPIPQSFRFGASPMSGAPPLNVSIGAFSSDPLPFDDFTIDYGDGSHNSLQQQCFEPSGADRICQIRTEHNYTSSGTFAATLRGIKKGNSQILGTLKIAVGNPLTVIKTIGEKESSFLIQKINRDSVDGLWSQAYPVATEEGTPKTLRIGDDIGYGCEGVSDKLTSIDFSGQRVTFTKSWQKAPYGGCPICLSSKTLIDTPYGLVLVKDLKAGMPIWTSDKSGHRVSGIVEKTSRVPVPPTHQMVHLILGDGRELFVSPPHPTIDGRTVGDLVVNELYDGARIVSSERVSYDDVATYDILPSGETGFYWANGILMGSTLR